MAYSTNTDNSVLALRAHYIGHKPYALFFGRDMSNALRTTDEENWQACVKPRRRGLYSPADRLGLEPERHEQQTEWADKVCSGYSVQTR